MGDVEKGIKFYNIGRKKGFFNGYFCSHVASGLSQTFGECDCPLWA